MIIPIGIFFVSIFAGMAFVALFVFLRSRNRK